MTCNVKIILVEYPGVNSQWGVTCDVVVTVNKPKTIVGIDEDKWSNLIGAAIGEAVGKELETKMNERKK